jgi:hypothetical protein
METYGIDTGKKKIVKFLILRYNIINPTVKLDLQIFVSLETSFVTRRTNKRLRPRLTS